MIIECISVVFRGFLSTGPPPYVPYISVDFARFLGTEVPPGYHTLAEMYERGGATLEALRGGVSFYRVQFF